MDKIIVYYIQNILTNDGTSRIPEYIIQVYKNHSVEKKEKTSIGLAYETFKALKIITSFLDRSELGFLTGDISLRIIDAIHKSTSEFLAKTSRIKDIAEKRDKLISECFFTIC